MYHRCRHAVAQWQYAEREFVDNPLVHWNATRKKKKQEKDDDYHGNFDAPKFEKWFAELCERLRARFNPPRSCKIYMDGAGYHKRMLNPAPTVAWKKADIQEWPRCNSKCCCLITYVILSPQCTMIDVPYHDSLIKAQLVELVRQFKPPHVFAAQLIARANGHELYYTPPHTPELQPIELIWAQAKLRIARKPAENATDSQFEWLKVSTRLQHSTGVACTVSPHSGRSGCLLC